MAPRLNHCIIPEFKIKPGCCTMFKEDTSRSATRAFCVYPYEISRYTVCGFLPLTFMREHESERFCYVNRFWYDKIISNVPKITPQNQRLDYQSPFPTELLHTYDFVKISKWRCLISYVNTTTQIRGNTIEPDFPSKMCYRCSICLISRAHYRCGASPS